MDDRSYHTAMLWYEVAGKVLYYISLPIVKVLLLVFYLLHVLLSPFIYIAQGFVQLCLIPYNIAAKFEVERHINSLFFTDSNRLSGTLSAAQSSSVLSLLFFCMASFESSS